MRLMAVAANLADLVIAVADIEPNPFCNHALTAVADLASMVADRSTELDDDVRVELFQICGGAIADDALDSLPPRCCALSDLRKRHHRRRPLLLACRREDSGAPRNSWAAVYSTHLPTGEPAPEDFRLRTASVGVGGGGGDDAPFLETVKGAAIQLLGFAEAISIGRRSPEKLFKILDLHDALADLLPDVADVFLRYRPTDPIHTQATEIVSRLAEAARGILSEFESAVLRDPSKIPVPGGTVHPLTRYVMNYISLISDYKPTLTELIVTKPAAPTSPRFGASPGDDDSTFPSLEMDLPESEDQSPLAAHLIWIIVILQSNLENKAKLYKDVALSHLFLMNNVHYIVNKVKGNPELREMIGDDYLRKMTGRFRQAATSYQRSAWVRVLHCLRDEGLHASGGFSSGISKSTLRERFRAFNLAFDEVHRTQSLWHVPDGQLREELRISISELLLPAYRSFLGRFRHHIESGRHPEMYIKYSVEDLETALSDFFEGVPPSLQNRRRSH